MGWKIGKEKYRLENIQNSPKNLFIRILAICVSVSQGQKRRGKREQFIDPFLRYRKAVNSVSGIVPFTVRVLGGDKYRYIPNVFLKRSNTSSMAANDFNQIKLVILAINLPEFYNTRMLQVK